MGNIDIDNGHALFASCYSLILNANIQLNQNLKKTSNSILLKYRFLFYFNDYILFLNIICLGIYLKHKNVIKVQSIFMINIFYQV